MNDMRYFGKYISFKTESKSEGAALLGADNLIGDRFDITFEVKEGRTTAWLVNKFGKKVGFFSPTDTYQLDVYRAREWELHALLSMVLYSENESGEGSYWGEMAVIAHPARYENEINAYLEQLGQQLSQGVRPEVDLTEGQINQLLAEKGNWVSPDKLSSFKQPKGTAVVKQDMSLSEKIIEEGRKGRTGCYVISWAFIVVVVVAVAAGIAKLLGLF